MVTKIFIDDIRTCTDTKWVTVRTVDDAVELATQADEFMLSLDHDLGGDATTRPLMTRLSMMGLRPVGGVVHSSNPVGREWLESSLDRDFGSPVPRITVPDWA